MKLYSFTDQKKFTQQASAAIEAAIIKAQQTLGEAHVAVSGGKSPIPVYQALAQSDAIDWSRLTFWLVDERYVPTDHEQSNERMIRHIFGESVDQLKAFHVFDTHLSLNEAAREYQSQLSAQSEPFFDLVLLGLGEDGHTASLFPGIPELHESEKLIVPTWAEGYPTPERLTMTFPALLNSQEIMFIIQGANKEKTINTLLSKKDPDLGMPSRFVLSHPHLSFYFLNQ